MNFIQKTILITGGTGFLGSNLINKLSGITEKIIILKRVASNIKRIEKVAKRSNIFLYNIDEIKLDSIFSDHAIDIIIHCATNYGRNLSNPMEIIGANFILPLELLQLSQKYQVKCFINTDTILDRRINFYSLSKSQFRQWLEMFSQTLCCINIELEHFYGPLDDDSKFVTFIIHSLLKKIEKIDLTQGEQSRFFIYIDDVIEAFIKIIYEYSQLGKGFFQFQVATDTSIKIREFVELAKQITENMTTKLNFGVIPYRNNEIMKPVLDTRSLKKLGWNAQWSLEAGLRKTIKEERKIFSA